MNKVQLLYIAIVTLFSILLCCYLIPKSKDIDIKEWGYQKGLLLFDLQNSMKSYKEYKNTYIIRLALWSLTTPMAIYNMVKETSIFWLIMTLFCAYQTIVLWVAFCSMKKQSGSTLK